MNADKLIRKSPRREIVVHKDGDVQDIINVILMADKVGADYTKRLAKRLKRKNDVDTLQGVYDFVKSNIRYKIDAPGFEKVKSPGATWKDKYGDCKSHTVFVGSLIKNMGYDYFYRVAFYDPSNPYQGHIYTVAIVDDKEVVLDTVNTGFDKEESFWKAYDYSPNGNKKKIQSISGLPQFKLKDFAIISAICFAAYKLKNYG